MASAMRVFRKFHSADGRIKAITASGVLALAVVVALAVGVLPAMAGEGADSQRGVTPELVEYGGGSGACDEFGSPAAEHELHINNPKSDIYEGPDGTKVEILVYEDDTLFDYWFLDESGNRVDDETTTAEAGVNGAYDITVNGGSQNTWYDNDGQVGVLQWDKGLHAPTKGNDLFKLSHINICYDETPVHFVCGIEENIHGNGLFTQATGLIFSVVDGDDNSVEPCEKDGFFSINSDPPSVTLDFGDGSGTVTGRLDVYKDFDNDGDNDPTDFVDLQYDGGPDPVNDVPWCEIENVDPAPVEHEFDDVLALDEYPNLPVGHTACKVFEGENAAGIQHNIIYFEFLDPNFF